MLISLIVVVVFLLYKRYKLSSKCILFRVSPLVFALEDFRLVTKPVTQKLVGKEDMGCINDSACSNKVLLNHILNTSGIRVLCISQNTHFF